MEFLLLLLSCRAATAVECCVARVLVLHITNTIVCWCYVAVAVVLVVKCPDCGDEDVVLAVIMLVLVLWCSVMLVQS